MPGATGAPGGPNESVLPPAPGAPGGSYGPFDPAFSYAFSKASNANSFVQALMNVLNECQSPQEAPDRTDEASVSACKRAAVDFFSRLPVRTAPVDPENGCLGGWPTDSSGGWYLNSCVAEPPMGAGQPSVVGRVLACFDQPLCRSSYNKDQETNPSAPTVEEFAAGYLEPNGIAGPSTATGTAAPVPDPTTKRPEPPGPVTRETTTSTTSPSKPDLAGPDSPPADGPSMDSG